MLRQLGLTDMRAAAQVHRVAFDQAMPWLVGLHTPDEDSWFYRERAFPACRVWGRFDDDVLSGIIAFREGWIEQLYVLPMAQGRGRGRNCSMSRNKPAIGWSFGPSSATRGRDASTKPAASRWSSRPTGRGMRKTSLTRAIFGHARADAHSTAYQRTSRGAAQSVTTDSISHRPGAVAANAMRSVWPGSMASVSSQ